MKNEVLVYVKNITEIGIEILSDKPLQINIFEEVEPEELHFMGFYSTAKYKKHLEKKEERLKEFINDNLLLFTPIIFEDLIFEINTLINQYSEEVIDGKIVLGHDSLELTDRNFIGSKKEIKKKCRDLLRFKEIA